MTVEISPHDELNDEEGMAKGQVRFDDRIVLPFSCAQEDVPELDYFSNYLESVRQGAAHLFVITPLPYDDSFEERVGVNVFMLPSNNFYRAYLVAVENHGRLLESAGPREDFRAYLHTSFRSFPAFPFLRMRENLSELMTDLAYYFPHKTRLLRGDTVKEVWGGRFDEVGNGFLYENPPPGTRKFSRLRATTEEWKEGIYPNSISISALIRNFDWLNPEFSSFDELWNAASRLLPPPPEQMSYLER